MSEIVDVSLAAFSLYTVVVWAVLIAGWLTWGRHA